MEEYLISFKMKYLKNKSEKSFKGILSFTNILNKI